MPLHLLGKKSWNVYNAANIEKVKRDEVAAAAREAAEEQRMQEEDAEQRMNHLRGIKVDFTPVSEEGRKSESDRHADARSGGRDRKRRKIYGEDDTERDIRYAKEDQALTERPEAYGKKKKTSDAPLTDKDGHISLFPMEHGRQAKPKNPEAEAEEKRKQRELEDQYTMRFSNAAGFKQSVGQTPWYHSRDAYKQGEEGTTVSKDVWGNEDPRRKERERKKLAVDDPLAMIQRGVQGVRKAEKDRRAWRTEKEREVTDLIEEEKRERRKKRHEHRRSRDEDHERRKDVKADREGLRRSSEGHKANDLSDNGSLDNFALDQPNDVKRSRDRHHSRPKDRTNSHQHRTTR